MLPVVELRGAIPVAMTVYGFSAWMAFFVAVIGNMVPAFFLVPLIGAIGDFLSEKSDLFRKTFSSFLSRTRNNHEQKFARLKEFTLVVLVAIPLPFTGVWTASLVAYVFGIPFRKAVPLIFLGVVIAGVIVVLTTMGIITLFSSI
ncbi:MAG: small multi-drug export protein [Candidatus Zambryskibacteria bacterium]|nr:small multi-drug export protein [Candidatus Zambryskibacteria bacterium]